MAYSDSFPATRPVFQADFANGGRVDPRITFSRSDTPPTYAAPSAVHYWSNEKHISSENLWKHSDDLSHADNPINDNVDNLTVTGGQTGPTSSITTAVEIKPNTSNTSHRFYTNNGAAVSSGQLTFSVYAKASGYKNLHIFVNGPDDGATFDLSAATVTNDATYPPASTSITQVGSTGWYRCTLTTNSFSGNVQWQLQVRNDSDDYTYTGDGTSAIIVYGGQINTGSSALDYQATTTQIHREYAPTLKSVSYAGQPRFEYSPTDSASEGLLIEGSSTNLVSYSESFSNQTINNSTLTEGAAVGPDGTLNANLLVPTSTGSTGRAVNLDDGDVISHTSGNNYAYSIFAKAAGYNYLQWVGGAYFGYTYCNFDLSNGTVGNKSGSVTGSVESVGNDWYRLTVVAPATTTNNTGSKGIWQVVTSSTAARGEAFTGNDYSGVLLTMAQCELSSFSSSYIRSDSGSAAGTTRAADSLTVAMADVGVSQGPVSAVVEGNTGSASGHLIGLSDGSSSNRWALWRPYATEDYRLLAVTDNATVVSANLASATKFAMRIDTDDFAVCGDGGTVVTDTAGVAPVTTTIGIGVGFNGSYQANGTIKRVALYNEALSDTNLQALTS